MRIELGCPVKKPGWVTVDVRGGPDIRHDLDVFPYPFDSGCADEIVMHHVLEHLKEPVKVILECRRILKPGGILRIAVPWGITTTVNPLHLHDFLPAKFQAFDHSGSPYLNGSIGGMFHVKTHITRGRLRFWKPYEITAVMRKWK